MTLLSVMTLISYYMQRLKRIILSATNHLQHGSQMLERLISENEISVIGAEYSLETGVVEFFDAM